MLATCLIPSSVEGETVIINKNGQGLGWGEEIGYLAGGFTCRITVTHMDEAVSVQVHEANYYGDWEWDEEDYTLLLPGESYTYWINATYPSTTRHMVYMRVVFNESHVEDLADVEMDIDIEVKDPDGDDFNREDLLDKDKVWEAYLESAGEYDDDDWMDMIPDSAGIAAGCICLPFFMIIIVFITLVIIRNKRKK
jgi:hypothetical protein